MCHLHIVTILSLLYCLGYLLFLLFFSMLWLLGLPILCWTQVVRSSCCDTRVSVSSWACWDAGSVPIPAWWVKDPVLPQLWFRSWLRLWSDPWTGSSICCGAAKNEKIKFKKVMRVSILVYFHIWVWRLSTFLYWVLYCLWVCDKWLLLSWDMFTLHLLW